MNPNITSRHSLSRLFISFLAVRDNISDFYLSTFDFFSMNQATNRKNKTNNKTNEQRSNHLIMLTHGRTGNHPPPIISQPHQPLHKPRHSDCPKQPSFPYSIRTPRWPCWGSLRWQLFWVGLRRRPSSTRPTRRSQQDNCEMSKISRRFP